MRRRIVAACLAGAAGVTIGLMPVATASASTTPTGGGSWRCSDNRWHDWRWDQCCNRDWRERPSWCWDDGGVGGNSGRHHWNNNRNDSNWRHSNWNDSGRGGNGDWGNHDWSNWGGGRGGDGGNGGDGGWGGVRGGDGGNGGDGGGGGWSGGRGGDGGDGGGSGWGGH